MLTNELSFKRPIDEKITLAKKIENRRTKDIIHLEPHLGTYHQHSKREAQSKPANV